MDFTWTDEQQALRDSVRRFTERRYGWEERMALIRRPPGNDAGHWPVVAELGWLGAGLSEAEGGFGGGAAENAVIGEEFGRALVIEPFAAHVMATQLLAGLATDRAGALIAAAVMGEQRIAPALTEAAGRGDWRVVAATAAAGADGNVRLSGAKSLVDGAAGAGLFLVTARDAGGETGLYLVAADAEGLTRRDYRTLDNHRVADLALDGVEAEPLATGAPALAAIERAADHGIVALCAEAVGIMDAALWATRDYLKVRQQFGTALGTFQALQHRMADMLIELEMARSILFHAIGAADAGDADARALAVSAAKARVGQAGLLVGGQAIQLHGGIGVTEELIVSHYYRRLYVIARLLGDDDMHTARFAAITDRLEAAA